MWGCFESGGGDAQWDGHGGRMMVIITILLTGGTLAASSLASRMMCIWHVKAVLFNRYWDDLQFCSWMLMFFSFMMMYIYIYIGEFWSVQLKGLTFAFFYWTVWLTVPGQIQSGQANHRWQRLQHEGSISCCLVTGPRYLETENDPRGKERLLYNTVVICHCGLPCRSKGRCQVRGYGRLSDLLTNESCLAQACR